MYVNKSLFGKVSSLSSVAVGQLLQQILDIVGLQQQDKIKGRGQQQQDKITGRVLQQQDEITGKGLQQQDKITGRRTTTAGQDYR